MFGNADHQHLCDWRIMEEKSICMQLPVIRVLLVPLYANSWTDSPISALVTVFKSTFMKQRVGGADHRDASDWSTTEATPTYMQLADISKLLMSVNVNDWICSFIGASVIMFKLTL